MVCKCALAPNIILPFLDILFNVIKYVIVYLSKGVFKIMANLEKLLKQQEELLERIEKEKKETHEILGEELIKQLAISYDDLATKKSIKEAVELIKESLSSNPFTDSDETQIENDVDINDTRTNEY